MRVVLAEKPSVARELASFLGASKKCEGYFEGKGYQVTWALGHLATLKEPQDYDPSLKKWSLDSLPIVPDKFGLKVITEGGARKQFGVIQRLFRNAESLIAATDAGREGELIFRYILELTGSVGKPAQRLWLSSLTETAIRDAFRNLKPLADYDRLYDAARCRSEADWLVGLNATRYYTVKYRGSGGRLWSVGRVQTPVLAMIANRDNEIRVFHPESFWELLTKYRDVTFRFTGDRFKIQTDADTLLDQVVDHPFVITKVDRKPERERPPLLHDLTDLQREMNRRYGMSADATLKAAQSLYESKLISYPRTDSRHLSRDLKPKMPGILKDLQKQWPTEVGRLDLARLTADARIYDDAKVADHHAIIPTGKSPGALGPGLKKVYDAIVLRLIAAFYPACVREVTTVLGQAAQVAFRARGIRVVEPGWTVLDPRKPSAGSEDSQVLPEFQVGETGSHSPTIRQGETSPPKPFTEGSLLGAMETAGKFVEDEALREALKERGLGTPATRASVIETLLGREYIIREGKNLAATDLGRYLIALVADRALKSPELTGDWEAKLREVERGQLDPTVFMAEIVRYAGAVSHPTEANAAVDPDQWGPCPVCGRAVIEGKRGFGCSGWKDGCPFKLWREQEGQTLTDQEIRQILQHRALFSRAGTDSVVLQLIDNGGVVSIPVPTGEPRRDFRSGSKGTGNARGSTAGRRTARPRATTSSPDPTASKPNPRKKASSGRDRTTPPISSLDRSENLSSGGFGVAALGSCPLCGGSVVEQTKSYGCDNWKTGCKFKIWKTIAGKKITIRSVQALLKKGRSPKLKGFESKTGQPFDAFLKLESGEVRFDFGGP